MSIHDLPSAALHIIDEQGWNDSSVNALLESYIEQEVEPFGEKFRLHCAALAAEEVGGAKDAFDGAPLAEIIAATGWNDDTMRDLRLSFYREGDADDIQFDEGLVSFLQKQADEENGYDEDDEDDEDDEEHEAGVTP